MSGFVIFALVLTFAYVVYFAVQITLDLHGKKGEKSTEEETYDVSDMANEEQPVAVEEHNDDPDLSVPTYTVIFKCKSKTHLCNLSALYKKSQE